MLQGLTVNLTKITYDKQYTLCSATAVLLDGLGPFRLAGRLQWRWRVDIHRASTGRAAASSHRFGWQIGHLLGQCARRSISHLPMAIERSNRYQWVGCHGRLRWRGGGRRHLGDDDAWQHAHQLQSKQGVGFGQQRHGVNRQQRRCFDGRGVYSAAQQQSRFCQWCNHLVGHQQCPCRRHLPVAAEWREPGQWRRAKRRMRWRHCCWQQHRGGNTDQRTCHL